MVRRQLTICFSFLIISFVGLGTAKGQSQESEKQKVTAEKKPSNFTGTVEVKMFTQANNPLNCSVGSVSFQPGTRTNWHKHAGGQILLITDGIAFYQERGGVKKILNKGELVSCPPNVEHWHGASTNGAMTHLAVGPNTDKGPVTWLEKVEEHVYLK